MSRKRTPQWRSQSMHNLSHALLAGNPQRRKEWLESCEKLHDKLIKTPEQTISPSELLNTLIHIEGQDASTQLFASGVCDDLREIIDQISLSLKITLTKDQGWMRCQELTRKLSITDRTLRRWREQGLRWRRARPHNGGRMQIMIHNDALDLFQSMHENKVEKASQFSRLKLAEQDALVEQARRIAVVANVSPARLARHLAKRGTRSHETIRQLLLQHDKDYPDNTIFADYSEPLQEHNHIAIYRAWSNGTSIVNLCLKWKRKRATIYRAIYRVQWHALCQAPVPYIVQPSFERPEAAEVLIRPLPEPPQRSTKQDERLLTSLPSSAHPFFSSMAMNPDNYMHWSLHRHFLHWKIHQERQLLRDKAVSRQHIITTEQLLNDAAYLHGMLFCSQARAIISLANRHLPSSLPTTMRQRALSRLLIGSLPIVSQAINAWNPTGNISLERHVRTRLMQRYATLQHDPFPAYDESLEQLRDHLLSALHNYFGDVLWQHLKR